MGAASVALLSIGRPRSASAPVVGQNSILSFTRFGGQVDYAACLIRAALSNSPGLKYPSVECLRSWL